MVTLNLLTAVPDGMIMLSDSMVTINDYTNQGNEIITTFEHAKKLTDLGSHTIAAAMISGAAAIDSKPISSMLREVSQRIDRMGTELQRVTHDIVVQMVVEAVSAPYDAQVQQWRENAAAQLSELDRLSNVNSEREKTGLPRLDRISPEQIGVEGDPRIEVPQPVAMIKPPDVTIVVASFIEAPAATAIAWPGALLTHPDPHSSLSWWGSGGSAVARLVMGFDIPRLEARAAQEARGALEGGAGEPGPAQIARNFMLENRPAFAMPTPIRAMPLQDAIEFTEYLGQVACGYDRFSSGPAHVGGELDVVVLEHGTRTWVSRKRIHSSIKRNHGEG